MEPSNSSRCVALGGINPVGDPDPACLERVDDLHDVVNRIWARDGTGHVRAYFLLLVGHHCDGICSIEFDCSR
jgi:hypothetical protein